MQTQNYKVKQAGLVDGGVNAMHVTLKINGEAIGYFLHNGDLPAMGSTIAIENDRGEREIRRIDEIEEGPSGARVVHLGGAQPVFIYRNE